MRPVILTAGRATRAGAYAPEGCKALVPLDGRPVIEWQIEAMGEDPVIVCRSEHEHLLRGYGETVINDEGKGAGDALASALPWVHEDIVVAYADTWFTELPDGTDWFGVWPAEGGRSWYVVTPHSTISYKPVPAGEACVVGVGLFAFSDIDRLREIVDRFGVRWRWHGAEWGLDVVVNSYILRPVPVPSWRDVGDERSIEQWRAA